MLIVCEEKNTGMQKYTVNMSQVNFLVYVVHVMCTKLLKTGKISELHWTCV